LLMVIWMARSSNYKFNSGEDIRLVAISKISELSEALSGLADKLSSDVPNEDFLRLLKKFAVEHDVEIIRYLAIEMRDFLNGK
jgi:hypothetical protein